MAHAHVYVHMKRPDAEHVRVDIVGEGEVVLYVGEHALIGPTDVVEAWLDDSLHKLTAAKAGGDRRFGDPTDPATYATPDPVAVDQGADDDAVETGEPCHCGQPGKAEYGGTCGGDWCIRWERSMRGGMDR